MTQTYSQNECLLTRKSLMEGDANSNQYDIKTY